MKKQKKNKQNWFYIILGLFFCLPVSLSDNNEIKHTELNSKTIIVYNDIYKFLDRRNKYRYRIWSREYESSFVIEPEGGIAANWKDLDNIKKNDTLIIEIDNNRTVDLDNKPEAITIYSLIKNNKIVYDLKSYNKAKKKYDRRWNITYIILSILLIGRDFNVFSSRKSYILAGLCALIIISLKILNIW